MFIYVTLFDHSGFDIQMNRKTLAFHTLGCKLNFSETSSISRDMVARGYEIVNPKERADVYVINSCTVTKNAEKRCRELIRKAMRLNPEAHVIIVGCYAQIKPEELASIPGVSMVLGNKEKFDLAGHLGMLASENTQANRGKDKLDTFIPGFSSDDRTRSFFKIQDGCDYMCSYCTIPMARGRSRSNSIGETLKTARSVAGTDMKEVVLTGVNIGDFGKPHGESFVDLLRELVKMEGLDRIRLSSVEPDLLSDEIIELAASEPTLMPHFHIPLQSGSDTILKAMGRKYDTELFAERISKIRELLPHACIAADVIAGFPGETEALFRETYDFISMQDISYLHVFTYSERENTKASRIMEAVNPAVSKERSQKLQQLSREKKQGFIKACQGLKTKVLWEKEQQDTFMYGFTENYIRTKTPYNPEKTNTIEEVVLNTTDEKGVYII